MGSFTSSQHETTAALANHLLYLFFISSSLPRPTFLRSLGQRKEDSHQGYF